MCGRVHKWAKWRDVQSEIVNPDIQISRFRKIQRTTKTKI